VARPSGEAKSLVAKQKALWRDRVAESRSCGKAKSLL